MPVSWSGEVAFGDDLVVKGLTGRGEAEFEIELLGAVRVGQPEDCDAFLVAATGFGDEFIDGETAVARALVAGGYVQAPDSTLEEVDRTFRVEAAHDEADQLRVVVHEARPSHVGLGVCLGQGHRDGCDDGFLFWGDFKVAGVADVVRCHEFQTEGHETDFISRAVMLSWPPSDKAWLTRAAASRDALPERLVRKESAVGKYRDRPSVHSNTVPGTLGR
jgi:hypothetical protein